MAAHIYRGLWVNWSHSLIRGATLTLDDREGGLLTAFIATFVTIAGAELWKIICYASHQFRSKHTPQDGLYHQQQVILRTSVTPGGAVWLFLQQAYCWTGRARMALLRTLPWTIFSALYIAAIGVTAVFSSQISKSPGPLRLLISDDCGFWTVNTSSPYQNEAFLVKSTNDSLAAATYAKACYSGIDDPVACGRYPVPSISWTSNQNATCPFQAGTCRMGDTAAYQMVSKKIDSHFDLGINAPSMGRIQVEKTTTCAPLVTRPFAVIKNASVDDTFGRPGDTVVEYNYGYLEGLGVRPLFFYNDHASFDQHAYSLSSFIANAGHSLGTGSFVPDAAINTTDGDLSLLFITPNSVIYSEPCDDPVFSAHQGYNYSAYGVYVDGYYPDYWVSVLGCTEQYRICDPETSTCTPKAGLMQLQTRFPTHSQELGFNELQNAIAARLMIALQVTSTHHTVFTRMGNALRASETLSTLTQRYLPPTQWHIEVGSWFDAGLARLQQEVQEYATGILNVPRGSYLQRPNPDLAIDIPYRAMCYSQLTRDSSDTASFSILGLAILFGVGGMIILVSLTADTIVGWLQVKFDKGVHARMEWMTNDKMQMQQLLHQEMKLGKWDNSKLIPVTVGNDKFHGPADRLLTAVLRQNGSNDDEGAGVQLVPEHFNSKQDSNYH